jgi:hypothetical protein
MNSPRWHCDDDLLERYASDETDVGLAASIEAHLIACGICRDRLTAHADLTDITEIWTGVREVIQRPPLSPVLRLLKKSGLEESDAVLLSASQSLRGLWTLATVVVLVLAVLASYPGHPIGRALYLLVAPLILVLGVVAAFNVRDPTSEFTIATPYSKIRLALLRTAAVTLTTVPLVVAMGAIVPGVGWLSIAWLGPALAMTLTALVLLTWWTPEATGATLSLVWIAVVSTEYGRHHVNAAVHADAQLCYLLLAAVTAVVLMFRVRAARTPGGYA